MSTNEFSAYQIQAMKAQLEERQALLLSLKTKMQALFTGSSFKVITLSAEEAQKLIKLADEVYIPPEKS